MRSPYGLWHLKSLTRAMLGRLGPVSPDHLEADYLPLFGAFDDVVALKIHFHPPRLATFAPK